VFIEFYLEIISLTNSFNRIRVFGICISVETKEILLPTFYEHSRKMLTKLHFLGEEEKEKNRRNLWLLGFAYTLLLYSLEKKNNEKICKESFMAPRVSEREREKDEDKILSKTTEWHSKVA
jgi:hypothetical protein